MEINIENLADEIILGKRLKRNDNLNFFKSCDLETLCKGADKIRKALKGDHVDLCTIINARSGKCPENCKFCAQSIFNKTNCETFGFLDQEKILSQAKSNEEEGVHRFSIVTSGKALTGLEFEKSVGTYKRMHEELKIGLCASMGFLNKEQLLKLKQNGVTTYHHNIETSKRNFPNICTTHSYDMKIKTLKLVKECGLSVCSGGIIGMGENFDDRIDMAISLSEIGVDSIPINSLMPIPGTPFENISQLSENEILRTVAMFRFINPASEIRLAAGRKLLTNGGEKAFQSGANATITGNMLTTSGTTIKSDKELLIKLKRKI